MSNGILDYVKDRRILTLIIVVAATLALDVAYGIHFGIEFAGGTQIPVALEHPVNVTTMGELINALNQRLSTFGLQQVTIEGVGNSNIYITIPTVSQKDINRTLSIIEAQGRFDGIVSGVEALNGSGVIKGSIGAVPPQVFNNTVEWQVDFFITQKAQTKFATAVLGQSNKPIYMFLDRPTSTVLLINSSLLANNTLRISGASALQALQTALQFGNQTIPVISVSNGTQSVTGAKSFLANNAGKYKTILASANIDPSIIDYAESLNYTVKLQSAANMTPTFSSDGFNAIVDTWQAVGLVSAPLLSPSITNGNTSSSYLINGAAPPTLNPQQKINFAQNQSALIASVLSGGALPVAVIPGTPTTIPATLGSYFLEVSIVAGAIAILAVSLLIVIRYRKLFLILPILLTTIMELFLIVSIIGLAGTIDLAGVAGMIAVVGTGVDAQIIITDEILRKKEDTTSKTIMSNAFYIVWVDAGLLIVAMLPLFLSSSLVTVIGFSEATIFGAILSVFITRPAYGAIISRHYG